MTEGYYPEQPDSIDDALDELLCEYVDGAMDPAVKSVFEEYLETDPALAAHVRCLSETRDMLCRIGACQCASATLHAQLRIRLANELARRNRASDAMWSRLGNVALLTSAASLVLIVAMMAGISAYQHTLVAGLQETITDVDLPVSGMEIADDAYGFLGAAGRLEKLPGKQRPDILGPVMALPVVASRGYMTPLDRSRLQVNAFVTLERMGVRGISP